MEEPVGRRRAHAVEFLFPNLRGCGEEGTDSGLSEVLGASLGPAAADRMGSSAGAPQQAGAGLHCRSAGLDCYCLSATLRAGIEPGRVHLGLLEAARATQRLSPGLLATQPDRPTDAAPHAPPPATDYRLLAAGFFMAGMTLYYAGLSRSLLKKPLQASFREKRGIDCSQKANKYDVFSERHCPIGRPEGLNQQALRLYRTVMRAPFDH